jgi:ankyrin repeat protein
MRRVMLLLGMGYALLAAGACGPRPTRPVGAAAVANAPDRVSELIADGHSADEADERGVTPLMWAARVDAVEAMRVLIDAGGSLNARDANNRWTPLLHAIHTQHPRAVALLLERGADPNLATPEGVTPLMMAADDLRPVMVKTLLQYGADPHVAGPGGATAFTQAVSGGALSDVTDRPLLGGCHPETVRAFLEHDPSLKIPATFAGRQAIWWARFHGCTEVLGMVDSDGRRTSEKTKS